MNYLKCKMCGEDLTLHHEEDVGLCDSCYELNEKYDREIKIVLLKGVREWEEEKI